MSASFTNMRQLRQHFEEPELVWSGPIHSETKLPKYEPENKERKPKHADSPWLISAAVDLLFICGLAPWILGFFVQSVLGSNIDQPTLGGAQQMWSVLFVVASLLIGEAHQFTSIVRFLKIEAPKPRSKKAKICLTLLFIQLAFTELSPLLTSLQGGTIAVLAPPNSFFDLAIKAVLCLFIPGAFLQMIVGPLAMIAFPVVLMQHFCGQARAIGMMYCGKQGFKLSGIENAALTVCAWSLVMYGTCSIAVPFGFTSNFNNTINNPTLFGGVQELALFQVAFTHYLPLE